MTHPSQNSIAAKTPSRRASPVCFGVCGWDYRDWYGPLYSEPKGKFRPLPLLAEFLDFVEVNATYYHPMGGPISERWIDETPPDFFFLVKAWKGWTHEEKPIEGVELRRFREVIDPLLAAGRLEGVLLQFPPWVREPLSGNFWDRLERLQNVLSPSEIYLEIRHSSLYHPAFFRALEGRQIHFVNVDLPEVGSLPPASTVNTSARSYLRIHGRARLGWQNPRAQRDERYDYLYPPEELEDLVETLKRLQDRVPRLLVGANNHFRAQACAAIASLRSLFLDAPVRAPQTLLSYYSDHFGAVESLRKRKVQALPSGEVSRSQNGPPRTG